MPRVRTRQFARRSTPNRSWTGFGSTAVTVVAAGTKVLIGSFSLSNPGIDETIIRTVGMLSVQSDQAAANEDQLGAFGIIMVTGLALAAGAASIPGPITDITNDGWFLFVPFANRFTIVSSVGFSTDSGVQIPFDSKAKRRQEDGIVAAIMVENSHATNGLQVSVTFRMLTMVTGT